MLAISIVYSRYFWLYLITTSLLVASLVVICLVDRHYPAAYTFFPVRGRIVKIFTDAKSVQTAIIMGGVGLTIRRYDHYRRNVPFCDLYVENEKKDIKPMHFDDFDQLYRAYYAEGDEVARCAGARFPVILNREQARWVCPVCGERNDAGAHRCGVCKLKIDS